MKIIKKVQQVICAYFDIHAAEYFIQGAIREMHRGQWRKSDDPYSSIEAHYRQKFKITVEVVNED